MKYLLAALLVATAPLVHAEIVEYDLTIAETRWSPDPAIKPVRGLTINGSSPGPTLRFSVGDTARIRVHNRLPQETTSIHWHGLLLPNKEDGVPHVTTPPIAPGTTHTFEFPIVHAGTYWYHSHTGLQEQEGLFGSIVIQPKQRSRIAPPDDHVVVLSDWTRESADEVMRTLKRGSEWYEFKKGTTQSLIGAIQAGALPDFMERERSRMAPMDISDVAYDAFLANGATSIAYPKSNGKRIKLRFINAAASTYFYLQSSTGPLQIVAADGPEVHPIRVKRLLTSMAETYDVLVDVPASGKWEVRATAQDGSGHTSIWLGSGEKHHAPDVPKPELYRMDDHLMAAMESSESYRPVSDQEALANEAERPLSPYARLRRKDHVELPSPSLPRRTIELRLTGEMERYNWSFNNKTMAEDGVIWVKKGEIIRLQLINDTMMHHPLHLHGHFFRIVDEQAPGDAALKHTVDLPPMGQRTIEFVADAEGDWMFHCHLLYHMHSGMARVFSYERPGTTPDPNFRPCCSACETAWSQATTPENATSENANRSKQAPAGVADTEHGQQRHRPDLGEHAHEHGFFLVDGSIQSHMSEGALTYLYGKHDFLASWEVGYPTHDLDLADYEIDLAWRKYYTPHLSTLLGWRFTNHHDTDHRAFAGLNYRLPYLIDTSIQVDSEGDFRFEIGKSLQINDHLMIFGEIEYDTLSHWEWSTGAEFMLNKELSLITQYHSEYGFGGGFLFRF